jgi:hypothetical protein
MTRSPFRSFERFGVDFLLLGGQASIAYGAATFSEDIVEDLVALKRTRRLSDYEVISNLVRIRLAQSSEPPRRLLQWAAKNFFRAEDRCAILRRLGDRPSLSDCRKQIAAEVVAHQARDTVHWRRRALRSLGSSAPVPEPGGNDADRQDDDLAQGVGLRPLRVGQRPRPP